MCDVLLVYPMCDDIRSMHYIEWMAGTASYSYL